MKQTQDQLIQSEKLAALGGLVAGVAHEINTPVGISVTAASSLMDETTQMAERYKKNKISRNEFKDYLNTANQTAKLILSNMERTANMVQSFKQVSVDQSTSQERKFKLKGYAEDVIRTLNQFITVNYHRPFFPAPNISAMFQDAGHILGSSIIKINIGNNMSIGFSGDLGRKDLPILKDPETFQDLARASLW